MLSEILRSVVIQYSGIESSLVSTDKIVGLTAQPQPKVADNSRKE